MFFIINGFPHAIRLLRLEPQLALRMFIGEDQSSPSFNTHLFTWHVFNVGWVFTM